MQARRLGQTYYATSNRERAVLKQEIIGATAGFACLSGVAATGVWAIVKLATEKGLQQWWDKGYQGWSIPIGIVTALAGGVALVCLFIAVGKLCYYRGHWA